MSESKIELIFEDPPASERLGRRSQYDPWLAKLRQHPGVWAKWPDEISNPSGMASTIRLGKRKAGPRPGEFEAVGRLPTPGRKKGWLYVRYVGVKK